MNKDEFMSMIDEWYDNDEHEKIISAILALPEKELDDDILGQLAVAYNNNGDYKQAIAVLESQRPRLENFYKWQYRMGYALMHAADDEECENNEQLRNTILDKARICFARCMNMNPPEDYLEDCDMYIEMIEERLYADEEDEDDSDEFAPEMYDDEEIDVVEEHIKEHFGEFPTVYHELHSPDIHVDICCVPPTEERNYYTLITMGMGAHIMNIPEEMPKEEFGRAELVMCLPPDWKLGETDDEWYWPISLIKNLARLPINCDTWLGWAHSVDNREPFAPNTELCGSILVRPRNVGEEGEECELPNGDKVRFYEIFPLYRTEMNFKIDHSAEALLDLVGGEPPIVSPGRKNYCPDYVLNEKSFNSGNFSLPAVDDGAMHIQSIREKHLPLDEINGYNHIAIFLRWAITRNLIAPEYKQLYPEVVEGVVNGTITDLRPFIRDVLGGKLLIFFFNFEGYRFLKYYYDNSDDEGVFYPCDVDRYAENYFGTERYNSEEFQDEAYLFVPFDEEYYCGLSAVIENHYRNFRVEFDKAQNEDCRQFAENVMQNLVGCPLVCVYPERIEEVRAGFEEIRKQGEKKGFTAVYIIYDEDNDASSSECLANILSGRDFSAPLTIAEIPVNSKPAAADWLRSWFGAKDKTIISADPTEFEENYGDAPVVISIDNDLPVIYVPVGNGSYCRMTADPRLNEAGSEGSRLVLNEAGEEHLLAAMVNFIGCRYRLFPPMENDGDILSGYAACLKRAKKEGFVPLIMPLDGEFFRLVSHNSECRDSKAEYGYSPDRLSEFRSRTAAQEPVDITTRLELAIRAKQIECYRQGDDFDADVVGEYIPNQPLTRFLGYWNVKANATQPVMLAEIPVTMPWQALAYAPAFGKLPPLDLGTVISAAKRWYERYGAVPATINRNSLEFFVERPVKKEEALGLALEMYALFPKLLQRSKLGELAGSLTGSTVWYLYWD